MPVLRVCAAEPARVADDWARLATHGSDHSIFASPVWHEALESTGVLEPGRRLLLAVMRGTDVVGIAALRHTPAGITFTGGSDLVDYHHFLYRDDSAAEVCVAIVRHLTREIEWTMASFSSLPGDTPTLSHLPGQFRAHGCKVTVEDEDSCPVIALPPTWEGYLGSLSTKNRHEVRRKLRRFETLGGARFQSAATVVGLERGLDVFFELHARAVGEKGAFWTCDRRRFLRNLVPQLAAENQVRVHTLWVGPTPVAASVNFVRGDCWYAYNSAYAPSHRALSPGFVNHALGIHQAIQEGAVVFDFLRGSESYKYLLGARDRPLHTLRVRRDPRSLRRH